MFGRRREIIKERNCSRRHGKTYILDAYCGKDVVVMVGVSRQSPAFEYRVGRDRDETDGHRVRAQQHA